MTFPDPGARLQRFVLGNFRKRVNPNTGFFSGVKFRCEETWLWITAHIHKPTFTLRIGRLTRNPESPLWSEPYEVGPQDLTEEEKRKLVKEFPGLPWKTVKIPTSPKPPKRKK